MRTQPLNIGVNIKGKIFKMERVSFNIKVPEKKRPILRWQDLALEIIKEMRVEPKQKGSVFKICKQDEKTAMIAFNDCKELNKPHIKYFFKVYSEIKKKCH